ncbi:hypothetical protein B0H11DRAFT_606166 [Mycena galericulata]|nr:hypothetical protein B0H11DRAFT_606166 [Mycena galericulata]
MSVPKGSASYDISAYMRVASLAIACYDYMQTIPFEYRMWRGHHLTLSFTLFFLIRYTSILVLTVSNLGFFSSQFTIASCRKYYIIPSVFKVVQTMVSQSVLGESLCSRATSWSNARLILGFRAYNLSRKSVSIGRALIAIYIMACALEWVTTLYGRQMVYEPTLRNCASRSPRGLLGGWVHYAVSVLYDFITSVICVVFLLRLKSSNASIMVKVTKMMLVDGVWYFVALAMVNFLNLGFYRATPEEDSVELQTAAASLGYTVTWIMSQRLIIHLHEASVERRNDSIGAAITITQPFTSAREVSRAIRSQFESKDGMGLDLTVPDFDLDSIQSVPVTNEDVEGVQVRIERTVRMERTPRVYELEDYTRHARSTMNV